MDAVFIDLRHPEGFAAEARQGLALGFAGKLVIDERQVALAHQAYAPTEAEIASARRPIAAFEAAMAESRGLSVFEGRAIDVRVVEAERSIMARARAAAGPGHEARTQPRTG